MRSQIANSRSNSAVETANRQTKSAQADSRSNSAVETATRQTKSAQAYWRIQRALKPDDDPKAAFSFPISCKNHAIMLFNRVSASRKVLVFPAVFRISSFFWFSFEMDRWLVNLNSDSLEVPEMISGSRGFLLPAKSIGYYRIYRPNNSAEKLRRLASRTVFLTRDRRCSEVFW
jgi:hypothetical protein